MSGGGNPNHDNLGRFSDGPGGGGRGKSYHRTPEDARAARAAKRREYEGLASLQHPTAADIARLHQLNRELGLVGKTKRISPGRADSGHLSPAETNRYNVLASLRHPTLADTRELHALNRKLMGPGKRQKGGFNVTWSQ